MILNRIELIEDSNFETIDEVLKSFEKTCKSVLILTCDADLDQTRQWEQVLKDTNLQVFGGLFPSIFFQKQILDGATLIVGFLGSPQRIDFDLQTCFSDLKNESNPFKNLGQVFKDSNSIIIWIDGISEYHSVFLEHIYDELGPHKRYIGGGTGARSFKEKPSVFSGGTLMSNVASIIGVSNSVEIEIGHGWHKLHGPFHVTRSHKNEVIELNYQDAYQVYLQAINQPELNSLPENFFELAKKFPFGIERVDHSMIVRDIVKTDGKSIFCVSEVPENSIIYILSGSPMELLSAIDISSKSSAKYSEIDFALVVDCISRFMYLGDSFENEIIKIKNALNEIPIFGALTIGEIANDGGKALEFYNKTCVVGCFEKDEGTNVVNQSINAHSI